MRSLIALCAFCVISLCAFSSTIYVPDDHPTIQGAINASAHADTIIVRAGTYVENIDFHSRKITVMSEDGPDVTTIDGNRSGSVVVFQGSEDSNTILTGFTITNGSGTVFDTGPYDVKVGGGIFCNWGVSPVITRNVIKQNRVMSDGTAFAAGGGICCRENSTPTIIDNLIMGNICEYSGGAIACRESAAVIADNLIWNNQSYIDVGGGIYLKSSDSLITNNVIWGNDAFVGGGIVFYTSSPTIANNVIAENTARDSAGIRCSSSGSARICNNFIFGNVASGDGGGMTTDSDLWIVNNTIVGNSAGSEGGGIWVNYYNEPFIANTIVWNNDAPDGPEIYYTGAAPTVIHCNVEGGWPGTGNIDIDPLFVDIAGNDFHLTWNSPCRDAGHNTSVAEEYDFEGDPRIALGTVDMGADEYFYHLYYTGDLIPGASVDLKVVGYPSAPITLYLGSGITDPPYSTQHGDFWLNWPVLWQGRIGTVPGNGVLVYSATVPSGWTTGSAHPLQALVGPWGGGYSRFSNLMTLEID